MPTNLVLLRNKADTTQADTDYGDTQALPSADDCFVMPSGSKWGGVLIAFKMLNSGGTRIANNSTLLDVTVSLLDRTNGVITIAQALAGHDVTNAIEQRVPEGMEVYVQTGALTSPPATIDSMDIYVTPMSVT